MGPLENDRQNVVTLRPPPPRALSNSIWRGDHQVDVSCKSGQIESTAIHHLNSPRSPRWRWQKIGVGCWSVSSLGPAVHWYAALEQQRKNFLAIGFPFQVSWWTAYPRAECLTNRWLRRKKGGGRAEHKLYQCSCSNEFPPAWRYSIFYNRSDEITNIIPNFPEFAPSP